MKLKNDFSNLEQFKKEMSSNLLKLWDKFEKTSENGFNYEILNNYLTRFNKLGLTFEYGLDAEPYDFETKTITSFIYKAENTNGVLKKYSNRFWNVQDAEKWLKRYKATGGRYLNRQLTLCEITEFEIIKN